MNTVRILFLADVCGEAAASALCGALPGLRRRLGADLVLVNAENAANENGVLPALCEALFFAGADVITGGNHTLKHAEMRAYLDNHPRALRPENLVRADCGSGHVTVTLGDLRILVANFMGTVFLSGAENPFFSCDALLTRERGKYDFAVCDLHAEATAEKGAFARDFAKEFSAIVGTHTHVPTADLTILDGRCGFITDLGMCGARESVLGVKIEESVRRFRTGEKLRYIPAAGKTVLMGALFEIEKNGVCIRAERIEETV